MTFALRRSLGGGRYASLRAVGTVDGAAGKSTLKLAAKQLGRRAGLYRLTATLADGGAERRVQLRIKRR